jgi:hypothetical protein
MRQQVQGEEKFLDEAQSRDCVKSCTTRSLLCSWWRQQAKTFPMHARMERELLWRHLIEGVQTPVIKGDRLWKTNTLKRIDVGEAVKQKGVKALNIEIEVEDCEECTATLSFYIVSGSNLSQIHMLVENLEATRVILDEGGWDRSTMSKDTSGEGVRATIWAQVQTAAWWWVETPQEKVWGPQYEPKIRPPHENGQRYIMEGVRVTIEA